MDKLGKDSRRKGFWWTLGLRGSSKRDWSSNKPLKSGNTQDGREVKLEIRESPGPGLREESPGGFPMASREVYLYVTYQCHLLLCLWAF